METKSNIKTMKYSEFLNLFGYDIRYSLSKSYFRNIVFSDLSPKFHLDIVISEDNYHTIDTDNNISGLDLNLVLTEHYLEFKENIHKKLKKFDNANFFKKNFFDTADKIEHETLMFFLDKLNSIDINTDEGVEHYFKDFIDTTFSDKIDLDKMVQVHLGIDLGDKVYLTKCLYVDDLFDGVIEGEVDSMSCSYLNFSDTPVFQPYYSFKTKNGESYNFSVNEDGSLYCSHVGWEIHRNKEDAISVKKKIIDDIIRKKELVYF